MRTKKLFFALIALFMCALTARAEVPRKIIYALEDSKLLGTMCAQPYRWGDSTYIDENNNPVDKGTLRTNYKKLGLSDADTVGWMWAISNGNGVGALPDSLIHKIIGLAWDTVYASETVKVWTGTDSVSTYVDTLYIREIHWSNLGLGGRFQGANFLTHLRKLYVDHNYLFAINTGGSNNPLRPGCPLLEIIVANDNYLGPDKDGNTIPLSITNEPNAYTKLKRIELQNNRFDVFYQSSQLKGLPALEYLNISNNKLVSCPFNVFPTLKVLKASNNVLMFANTTGLALDTMDVQYNRFRFSSFPQALISQALFNNQDTVKFAFDTVFHFEKEYNITRGTQSAQTVFTLFKKNGANWDPIPATDYQADGGKFTFTRTTCPTGTTILCQMTNSLFPDIKVNFVVGPTAEEAIDYNQAQALRNFLMQVNSLGSYNYAALYFSDAVMAQFESDPTKMIGSYSMYRNIARSGKDIVTIAFTGSSSGGPTVGGTLDCQYFKQLTTLNITGNSQTTLNGMQYSLNMAKVINLNTNADLAFTLSYNGANYDTLDFSNCPNITSVNITDNVGIGYLKGLTNKSKLTSVTCGKPSPTLSPASLYLRQLKGIDLSGSPKVGTVNLSFSQLKKLSDIKLDTLLTSPSLAIKIENDLDIQINTDDLHDSIRAKITSMELSGCELDNVKVIKFSNLPKLNTLRMASTTYWDNKLTDLSKFTNLPALMTLTVNGHSTIPGKRFLSSANLSTLGSDTLKTVNLSCNVLTSVTFPNAVATGFKMNLNDNLLESLNIPAAVQAKFANTINSTTFVVYNNKFKFSTLHKNAENLTSGYIYNGSIYAPYSAYYYSPQLTIEKLAKPTDTIDLSSELYVALVDTTFFGGVKTDSTTYLWVNINGTKRDTLTQYIDVIAPGVFKFNNLPVITAGDLICEMRNKVYPSLVLQCKILNGDGETATITGPADVCPNTMVTYRTESGKSNYRWIITPKLSGADGNDTIYGTDSISIQWNSDTSRLMSAQLNVFYTFEGSLFEKKATKSNIVFNKLTKQPVGGDYNGGATITLFAKATQGVSYKWYQGETLVYTSTNASDTSCVINNFSIAKAGDYHLDAVFTGCTIKSNTVPVHIYPIISTKAGIALSSMNTFYVLDSAAIDVKSTNTEVPMVLAVNNPDVLAAYRLDTAYFLRPIKPDTTSITFNQPASGVFAAAKPVVLSVTVAKGSLTITAIDTTKTIGSVLDLTSPSLYTIEGKLKTGDALSGVTLTSAGAAATAAAGTYDIIPSNAQGVNLGNYNIFYIEGTLTIAEPENIKTGELSAQVKVYPNPVANGILSVNIGTSCNYMIQLIDITGKIVKEVKDSKPHLTLNVQGLKGLYTMKIQTSDEIVIRKIVIE